MLRITDVSLPDNGGAARIVAGTHITYTPARDFFGTETFSYEVSDGNGGSDTTAVHLTVIPVNDAPLARADSFSTAEDTPLVVVAPGILGNDVDAEGDSLTVAVDTAPGQGTLALSPDGSFTYTPSADFFGTESFTYVALDDSASSAPVRGPTTGTQA